MSAVEPSEFVASLKFPDEWYSAPWGKCEILATATLKRTGKPIILAGGFLDDGTLLYGLRFPGGQRVMRISPDTDWAIEERFRGNPHWADRGTVDSIWRRYIDSMIDSKRMAEDELGPPPGPAEKRGKE